MDNIPKLCTVAEAATILRNHPNTVRKLIREGRLKRIRPQLAGSRRHIKILEASIIDFMNGRDLDECERLEVSVPKAPRRKAREKRLARAEDTNA